MATRAEKIRQLARLASSTTNEGEATAAALACARLVDQSPELVRDVPRPPDSPAAAEFDFAAWYAANRTHLGIGLGLASLFGVGLAVHEAMSAMKQPPRPRPRPPIDELVERLLRGEQPRPRRVRRRADRG